jgi:carboxyl-terminal processing protease
VIRRCTFAIWVCAVTLAVSLHGAQSVEARFQQARSLLEGEHKDVPQARNLLLEVVRSAKGETLIWADIYLGYIEDRANNRQTALGWYESALKVKGASPSSLEIAKYGLKQPLVWIRHLDPGIPQPAARPPTTPAAPKAKSPPYVTGERPAGLTPATNLSAEQRLQNFEALWSLIDANYAHFELKSIDWAEVHRRYLSRLNLVKSDDGFYLLMFQLVSELKDTHSWLDNYRESLLVDVPDMPLDIFRGRPFVIAGARAGWEVISVDGMAPEVKMESLRPYLRGTSSTRAYQREAIRSLLAGKEGENVSITLRSPDGRIETESLVRSGRKRGPPVQPAPGYLTRQRFVHFGLHPSGVGYIKIESFNGREEITQEFNRALEALREAPALILDIRDNSGGFGHSDITGRFVQERVRFGFSYVKNGPGHTDFARREAYLEPSGPWQYTRPVALLVNDVTGSASDLFTTELRSAGTVITLGTTTHGNLSGVATYAVLSCGLVVRISNGYIADANDRPIEVNGNTPDIPVDVDIQDYLSGRDPVLERAVETVLKKKQ